MLISVSLKMILSLVRSLVDLDHKKYFQLSVSSFNLSFYLFTWNINFIFKMQTIFTFKFNSRIISLWKCKLSYFFKFKSNRTGPLEGLRLWKVKVHKGYWQISRNKNRVNSPTGGLNQIPGSFAYFQLLQHSTIITVKLPTEMIYSFHQ